MRLSPTVTALFALALPASCPAQVVLYALKDQALVPVVDVARPHADPGVNGRRVTVTLEAVGQWRFFPRVRGGVAIESDVEMPIAFAPDRSPRP